MYTKWGFCIQVMPPGPRVTRLGHSCHRHFDIIPHIRARFHCLNAFKLVYFDSLLDWAFPGRRGSTGFRAASFYLREAFIVSDFAPDGIISPIRLFWAKIV